MRRVRHSTSDSSPAARAAGSPNLDEILETVKRVVRDMETQPHRDGAYWLTLRDAMRQTPPATRH
jgi:hypothetical protein